MAPIDTVRSALFLPASNARAIAKARGLPCDLVILDLEDAVADDAKDAARAAAVAAANEDWGDRILCVRVNGPDGVHHAADVAAIGRRPGIGFAVLPKVEDPMVAERVGERLGMPLLAMIETPAGIYAARAIAALPAVAGLIVGPNDLAASLRLPADAGRAELAPSLHMILLAARAAGKAAIDGVFNRLEDADGFAADAQAGRRAGFDGKTLIHPNQIAAANRIFGPSDTELEEARALVAAATGGAARFRGRMIEAMHVAAARAAIARARPA